MTAPERIWTCNETKNIWISEQQEDTVEYIRKDISDAQIAALQSRLEARVKPLEFHETNNCPPTWDTGFTETGRYRVVYCGDEKLYKVIRGHSLIVGREMTPEAGWSTAQGDHQRRILSALQESE